MNKRWLLCAVLLPVLSGCSSVLVRTDYNESTDFSVLKTYAWKFAEQPQTGDPRIDNDLLDERIRAAVDAELAAKKFQRLENGKADFLVAYFVDYERRIAGSSTSFGLGAMRGGGYGAVGYNTMIYDFEEGELTLDVIETESGKTIWRGVGVRAAYSGSNPDKLTRIVNEAVARILRKFPPPKK